MGRYTCTVTLPPVPEGEGVTGRLLFGSHGQSGLLVKLRADLGTTETQYTFTVNAGDDVLVTLTHHDAAGNASPPSTVTATAPAGLSKPGPLALAFAAIVDPPPSPPPPSPPVPPPAPPGRKLVGGWRLAQEFARGAICIDFDAGKLWLVGHAQRNEVVEYTLPPMGTGTDPAQWPAVTGTVIPGWWPASEGYANGLCFWQGTVWAAPRVFYDTAPPPDLTLYAMDGRTLTVPLPRQAYSGFVKRGPGVHPLLGCGGYESGQGSVSGPTLAYLSGEPLISHRWPADPADWDGREKREADYYPAGHADSWVAWEPRSGEGRWACDRVYGGGLVLPEGVTYWAWMGVGDIDYARQNDTFAATSVTRAYRYDATDYKLLGWSEPEADGLKVVGQEIDGSGRVYLCKENAWASGMYKADAAVFVYE